MPAHRQSARLIAGPPFLKLLTYPMFMMFAMTTESVAVIIPALIKSVRLGMAAAGAFDRARIDGRQGLRPEA